MIGVNTSENASVEFLDMLMRKVHYTAFEMVLGISADEDKEGIENEHEDDLVAD